MASIDLERLREQIAVIDCATLPVADRAPVADRVTMYSAFREEFPPLDLARTVIEQAEEIERLKKALKELLQHAGIADAAPEDIDAEDHAREREARAALASTPAQDGE